MITSLGLGCPRVALGLNGPSYPYPLRMLQGLGDEPTPTNIAAIRQSVIDQNAQMASFANSVLSAIRSSMPNASLVVVPGFDDGVSKVPDTYSVQIGSWTGVLSADAMRTMSAATVANNMLSSMAWDTANANAIVTSTSEPTPAPISRMPIRTPMPTPVQPPSQLQIYQPRVVTDVRLATAQPAGVTPTTGSTVQLISAPPLPQAGVVNTGVQTQYGPVSTDSGYASAGADGQVATSPISDFLQGTLIGSIPNWILLVGAVGAFALFRKGK